MKGKFYYQADKEIFSWHNQRNKAARARPVCAAATFASNWLAALTQSHL
jgi:hypothetical protein